MSETLDMIDAKLLEVGFMVTRLPMEGLSASVFEDATVLGFCVEFPTLSSLIGEWEMIINRLTDQYQLSLRRSGEKAWNAYAILITREGGDDSVRPILNSIEENLVGLRKIARDGVSTPQTVTRAILPLLPLISSPELPVIRMEDEIEMRTGDIPGEAMKAFFSNAPESIALQIIEEL